jgi:O-antigen/teichoic acid export membrane protein
MSVETLALPPEAQEQGLRRRAASNTIYIFIGSVVSRLMGLVLVGYLARNFDVAGLGSYNLVAAYTGLFSLFADVGLLQYLTRELAARPHERDILLRRAAVGSLISGAIAFALCNGLALTVGYQAHLLRWILIASLPLFLGPAFVSIAVLNAGLRGRRVAALAVANQALGALVVLFVVVNGSEIQTLIVMQAVQSLVYAVLIAWSVGVLPIYRRAVRPLPIAAGLRMVWAAIPIGAMTIVALVYYRLDTFLLSIIKSETEVGYYSGAWRLTEALNMVPLAVAATMLPLAGRVVGDSIQHVSVALRLAFRFLVLIGVPIVVGCILLAKPILGAIYGPALKPASHAFQVLIVAELAFFFTCVMGATLVGLRQVRRVFIGQVISVPLNVAACALILPRYGYDGAAWISLATEAMLAGYLLWALRSVLAHEDSLMPWGPTLKAIIASIPMGLLVLWLRDMGTPLVPTIISAAALFGLALIAVRGVGREDLRLVSALRGGK